MFINVYNFDFVFRNAKDGNYHVLALLRNIWKLRPQSYIFYKYVFILLHASANMKCDTDSIILRLITQQQKCREHSTVYEMFICCAWHTLQYNNKLSSC